MQFLPHLMCGEDLAVIDVERSGGHMRRLVIGLCIAGFAAAACNRAPDSSTSATGTPNAQPDSALVATTGTGEPARDRADTADRAGAADRPPLERAAPKDTSAPKAVVRDVTIPAGTELPIVLDTSVGSKTSRVEEPVRAHLSRAISVDGREALADGSTVSGVVTDATPAAKVKGRAHLAVRFDSITPRGGGERYRIDTAAIGRTAPATTKNDAVKIGAPAAGGAIIGAIIGGGKGAAIGAAAGGGAGTAVVLSTAGKETSLPVGSVLRLRLTSPLTVHVRG
jgi:hypothetical protein